MERVLVMEAGEGIWAAVRRALSRQGGAAGAAAWGAGGLLVISPRAARLGEGALPPCRTVLLPGDGGARLRGLRAASAVSYGASPRDSLTLSSREGDKLWTALQREVVTLGGVVVERQEFPIPLPGGGSGQAALAAAGALLLLGVPPSGLWRALAE